MLLQVLQLIDAYTEIDSRNGRVNHKNIIEKWFQQAKMMNKKRTEILHKVVLLCWQCHKKMNNRHNSVQENRDTPLFSVILPRPNHTSKQDIILPSEFLNDRILIFTPIF